MLGILNKVCLDKIGEIRKDSRNVEFCIGDYVVVFGVIEALGCSVGWLAQVMEDGLNFHTIDKRLVNNLEMYGYVLSFNYTINNYFDYANRLIKLDGNSRLKLYDLGEIKVLKRRQYMKKGQSIPLIDALGRDIKPGEYVYYTQGERLCAGLVVGSNKLFTTNYNMVKNNATVFIIDNGLNKQEEKLRAKICDAYRQYMEGKARLGECGDE